MSFSLLSFWIKNSAPETLGIPIYRLILCCTLLLYMQGYNRWIAHWTEEIRSGNNVMVADSEMKVGWGRMDNKKGFKTRRKKENKNEENKDRSIRRKKDDEFPCIWGISLIYRERPVSWRSTSSHANVGVLGLFRYELFKTSSIFFLFLFKKIRMRCHLLLLPFLWLFFSSLFRKFSLACNISLVKAFWSI